VKGMTEQEHIHMMSPIVNGATPWWAKLTVQICFWFGPTVVVAAVFIGMWTGWLPSPITDSRNALTRLETKLDGAIFSMHNRMNTTVAREENQLRVLLTICRNVASTDIQKAQCDDYWRR